MVTWFEYIKPQLAAGKSVQLATAAYFEQYFPKIHKEASVIASSTIAQAELIDVPEDVGMPDDQSPGLMLVVGIIESRLGR